MGFNPQQGVWENVETKVLLSVKKKRKKEEGPFQGFHIPYRKPQTFLERFYISLFGPVLQSTRQYTKATSGLFWTLVMSMHWSTGH